MHPITLSLKIIFLIAIISHYINAYNYITGGDELLETAGRFSGLQRLRPQSALLAAVNTPGHIRGAVRPAHPQRGRRAVREAVARDLVDRAHAHHTHKAKDLSAQRHAIHEAA